LLKYSLQIEQRLICDIVVCLRSNVPEFTELKNWPPNSPDLNAVDYFVWGVATDSIYGHKNFRHWPAKSKLVDCWVQVIKNTL